MPTILAFFKAVRDMRYAQQKYYRRGRNGSDLRAALAHEAIVDKLVAAMDESVLARLDAACSAEPAPQPSLWDAPHLDHNDEAILDELYSKLGDVDEAGGL